jgi:hypothetical protein
MSNLFQKLEQEAFRAGINPRTEQSRKWFINKVKNIQNVNQTQLMKEQELELMNPIMNRTLIGNMFMYFYDPKLKEELPYYDRFPLTVVVGPAPGGFYGLNLHYLAPVLRAKMLDGLMDITNNKAYDESTRFRIRYNVLQSMRKLRYYEPCFKHYLTKHVKGRIAKVYAPEWEIATFLPTAIWRKSNAQRVYRDSRRMII